MSDREERIIRDMQYCQHYDPQNMFGLFKEGGGTGVCKAGINAKSQFGSARRPCLDGNKKTTEEQLSVCPKWLQRTREMGEKRADDIEKSINQMTLVMPIVSNWKAQDPIGKQEIIECPVCAGQLHLVQSSYNGHVHGNCETEDCVRWME